MERKIETLKELYERAQRVLVKGVSASSRFNPTLGYPLYITSGNGSKIYDIEGREYIDYNLSHGATFLGYNHPRFREAFVKAIEMGLLCGYETEYHYKLANLIVESIPCAEKVRFATSGSEANSVALRISRKFTGKKKYLKFQGHFHGLHDYFVYNTHSLFTELNTEGVITLSVESEGIPQEISGLVEVIPWQNLDILEKVLKSKGREIAAIIMEPINYNSGCFIATKSYMEGVRELCTAYNIVLIYDEVLSGFRTGVGCAQEYYGVKPDLCTLAKAVANGAPLAVIAGKAELMEQLTPIGKVVHSGTYAGHLFPVLAGIASIEEFRKSGFYDNIYCIADKLYQGLQSLFDRHSFPARVKGIGARFGIHFGVKQDITRYEEVAGSFDSKLASQFYYACFERGIYFHNYGTLVKAGHHGFSASHSENDIDLTLQRIDDVLKRVKFKVS